MSMTLTELEELEALHAAATPANYRTDTDHPDTIAIIATMNAFPAMAKALREALIAANEADRERSDWMHSLDRAKDDIITLMRERDALRAEVDDFAVAVGYGERPEGQSGVHRLSGEQLAECWKQRDRELDAARAEVEKLCATLHDIAEGDCEYGDNCPSNAGTRHGTCTPCKARQALEGTEVRR